MSDNQNLGFGKFVPGFDFLQNLAKGASQTIPQMPNLANWVAPTLNIEELEKRIADLKAVHFWLDQNSMALGATIQALEVQKMTLATLQGMNFNMGDLANALKLKTTDAIAAGVQKATDTAADAASAVNDAVRGKPAAKDTGKGGKAAAGVIDPLQWWGALTQQFQQIASGAMTQVAQNTAMDAAKSMGSALTKSAVTSATDVMQSAAPGSGAKPARKAAKKAKAPRKAAPRKART
jgi:hypothetical protein